ncbi:MAG: SET domain-containing protein-lysine N-methyltransferase [Candidatus Scalindua sp.]
MSGQKLIKVQKSTIHSNGVFAKRKISKNAKIAFFKGYEVSQNTEYSLSLDGIQIEPTGILKQLNHSCTPNAVFKNRWLISIREILPSEETTINYLATENSINHNFPCNCGSEKCRHEELRNLLTK